MSDDESDPIWDVIADNLGTDEMQDAINKQGTKGNR